LSLALRKLTEASSWLMEAHFYKTETYSKDQEDCFKNTEAFFFEAEARSKAGKP